MKIFNLGAGIYFLILLGSILVGAVEVEAQSSAATQITQVNTFLENTIRALMGLAGLVATGFFALGGFAYMTSAGNPTALTKAKRTLVFAGIGLVITIGAFALSGAISELATKAFN